MILTPNEQESFDILVSKCKSTLAGPWKLDAYDWVFSVIAGGKFLAQNGCCPSVPIAQAILESGWGLKGFLFGIKATAQDIAEGQAQQVATHEVEGGALTPETDAFFLDKTIQGNFVHYLNYLKRMKPAFINYFDMTPGLADAGERFGFVDYLETNPRYSTSFFDVAVLPNNDYRASIMSIIDDNKLWVFDHT